QAVDVGFIVAVWCQALGDDEDAFLDEPLGSPPDRRPAHAGAPIEDTSVFGGDPFGHLREGNGVGVLLKPEGPAQHVERNAQLSFGEIGRNLIEELVGDLGIAWLTEATEAIGWIWWHQCPSMALDGRWRPRYAAGVGSRRLGVALGSGRAPF